MVHAKNLIFKLDQVGGAQSGLPVDFGEMFGEGPGHDDFAHIMHQAGDVIGLIGGKLHGGGDFAGEESGADAVPPEIAPREIALLGEPLEILNDGCHHRELADLADAQIENSFLDAVDRGAQAVVDRVDQAQQSGGETGVTPDDFRDVRGVPLLGD